MQNTPSKSFGRKRIYVKDICILNATQLSNRRLVHSRAFVLGGVVKSLVKLFYNKRLLQAYLYLKE